MSPKITPGERVQLTRDAQQAGTDAGAGEGEVGLVEGWKGGMLVVSIDRGGQRLNVWEKDVVSTWSRAFRTWQGSIMLVCDSNYIERCEGGMLAVSAEKEGLTSKVWERCVAVVRLRTCRSCQLCN